MAISKKLRFEVFKRDSFKCQYCGRSAPEVILHADHVHPESKDSSEQCETWEEFENALDELVDSLPA